MEDIFDEITEQDQPIYEPEPMPEPDVTCDSAYIVEKGGKWYVEGYRDGQLIISMGGWPTQGEHVNAVLYDAQGGEVEHEMAETEDDDFEEALAILRGERDEELLE